MTPDEHSSRRNRWRERRRQRREHTEFRIAEPRWGETEQRRLRALADQLSAALAEAVSATRHVTTGQDVIGEGAAAAAGSGSALNESSLAAAATNLWRARKKLARSGDEQSRAQRQIGRYLRSSEEALRAAGVRIQDHDGTAFDSRLSLEALTFQDDPTLSMETVTDTVRPSIYLDRRCIQMGQVIVGRPPVAETDSPERENNARHD